PPRSREPTSPPRLPPGCRGRRRSAPPTTHWNGSERPSIPRAFGPKAYTEKAPWLARTNMSGPRALEDDPVSFQDKTLTCKDCGQEFIWTAGEQEFYASRGLQNAPTRCPADRAARRAQGGGRGGGGGGGYDGGGGGGGCGGGGGGYGGGQREL